MTTLIQLDNVSFSYPSSIPGNLPTLENINFTIEEGEFVALIGANGSGKSTLAKLLNALLLPDSGHVRVAGLDTHEPASLHTIRTRVGMVFQRPQDQIVATTVEEDVAFGPANLGLPHQQVRERVEQSLAATGLSAMQERSPFSLSAGEAQRLALAGVLAMRPQCLIFDETTAMLDPAGRDMVLQQAKALNREGYAILLITHIMAEAATADRVIVLHQGRLLMDGSPASVFSRVEALQAAGLDQPGTAKIAAGLRRYFPSLPDNIILPNQLFQSLPVFRVQNNAAAAGVFSGMPAGEPSIDVQNLSHTYMQGSPLAFRALDQLSMQVSLNTIHGLIGSTGSGKSTLLQHLNGLLLPQTGSIRVAGFDLTSKELDVRALRRTVALAFQQPEDQIFEQYVGDEIAYGPRQLGYDGKLADIVQQAMEMVGLDFTADKDRLTATLSGGEQRKVALASTLAVQSEILLLDEPMAGLDPQSVHELLNQLEQIHKNGTTLIISTHQYDELAGMLDQISVLHHGSNYLHGSCEEVFSRMEALHTIGLQAPLAVRTAAHLRSKGWPLRSHITTMAALERELENVLGEGIP
ncbi:MAG: energy-coupling factor transporter ATPase [Anaerolineales bacterium]|nr:energy-coupling factor transporter ATPase [Anaerolineales bacterium]